MPYQAPSIMPVLQAFEMARSAKERRDEQERARQYQIEDREYASTQDSARWDRSLSMEKTRWDREQKTRADTVAAEKQQKDGEARAQTTDRMRAFYSNALKADPARAPQLQAHIDKLAAAGKIEHFALPQFGAELQPVAPGLQGPPGPAAGMDPRTLAAFDTEAQAGLVARGEGPKPPDQPMDEIGKRVILGRGINPDQEGFRPAYQEELAAERAEAQRRARAGASSVTAGNTYTGPTNKTRTDAEDTILAGRNTMAMVDELKSLARNENGQVDFSQFQGVAPRVGKWALSNLDDVDPRLVPEDARPWLDKASAYRAVLDKYRSEEFKRLLGSAQTDTEIKNLVNSVLSADMGSRQFTQAVSALERSTTRAMKASEEVLSRGIRIDTPEYRKAFREAETRIRDGERSPAAAARSSGKTPEQIAAEKVASGEWTPEEVPGRLRAGRGQ